MKGREHFPLRGLPSAPCASVPALALLLSLTVATSTTARGQLAITEVMSSAARTHAGAPVLPGPDFWELTNYGTQAINLTGLRFNDNTGGLASSDGRPFEDRILQPGSSLIFVQREDPPPGVPPVSADSFRALWGLGPSVPVVFYTGNGFGAPGDQLWLWDRDATANEDFADQVTFGEATSGRTFTYDSSTGLFGGVSVAGVDGAFRAALSDDVGSPGIGPVPIPLAITQAPRSVVANPGDTVTFSVSFRGLPKPSCAWFFNNSPTPIAHGHSLTLIDVQFQHEGRYHVVLDNARSLVISQGATLNLRRQPSPPSILQPLRDLEVYIGQSASFHVTASGVPQPTFQWWFNESLLNEVIEHELALVGVQPKDAGRYSVVATNPLGAVTNSATLRVTSRTRLAITEVMSSPATNSVQIQHDDWWELTNLDDHTIDLFGYRFDDGGDIALPSLASAWTIPAHQLIRPGESVIFVENLSADAFRQWWGLANLPAGLQIITYRGAALSLSALRGDVIWLWNPGATDDKDYVVGVEFVPSPFGQTFAYDPIVGNFLGTSVSLSVDGVNGAFVAAEGGDIGSPGYIVAPEPKILQAVREDSGCRLKWRAIMGRRYTLLITPTLNPPRWEVVASSLVATAGTVSYLDVRPADEASRYYRVGLETGNR